MQKRLFTLIAVAALAALLASCAVPKTQMMPPEFAPRTFDPSTYTAKVDNFLVVLDASSSMSQKYGAETKFYWAREMLQRMNRTIPAIPLKGALRSFGHDTGISKSKTALFYGLSVYRADDFAAGLDAVAKSGGTSPMGPAILAAGDDLKGAAGKIAAIIVSDGEDTGTGPLAAAESLKARYGSRLCIYTVLVGDSPAGKELMEALATAGMCGFATTADDVMSSDGMAAFVEKVFLAGHGDKDGDGVMDNMDKCPNTPAGWPVDADGCALDSDGDGVYDALDKCPQTPAGVKVNDKGCSMDADGDGVQDDKDACPNTPRGAMVNARGCWILGGVLFDTAKHALKSEAFAQLNNVADVLRENPDLKIKIAGHTDNIGSRSYNLKLSENRARTVMQFLINSGIAPERLSIEGFGFDRPTASNDSEQGRAWNRRVELTPMQ